MFRIDIAKTKSIVLRADGFSDMANYSAKHRDPSLSSGKGDQEFTGTRSFDEARNLMVSGWSEPLERIETIRDQVRQRVGLIDGNQFQFDHAPYGTRLDVSAYSVGSPLALLQAYEEPERRKTRFVRILVDTSVSWMVDKKDIQIRGAAIVALCDALNTLGYSTEVWATSSIGADMKSGGPKFVALVPVQGVGEPWDVRSAMFPLAHASFLRRIVFGLMESLSADERQRFGVPGGYGYPSKSTKGSLSDVHCGGADVICPSEPGEIKHVVNNPVRWVLDQCKNLGVISSEEAE
jgi:hypothetical protein